MQNTILEFENAKPQSCFINGTKTVKPITQHAQYSDQTSSSFDVVPNFDNEQVIEEIEEQAQEEVGGYESFTDIDIKDEDLLKIKQVLMGNASPTSDFCSDPSTLSLSPLTSYSRQNSYLNLPSTWSPVRQSSRTRIVNSNSNSSWQVKTEVKVEEEQEVKKKRKKKRQIKIPIQFQESKKPATPIIKAKKSDPKTKKKNTRRTAVKLELPTPPPPQQQPATAVKGRRGKGTKKLNVKKGAEIFECSVCSKEFARSAYLTLHMRLHTGDRPYACRHGCDKAFSYPANRIAHERLHTGEKPYACSECPKTFANASNFKKHKVNHEKNKTY